MSEKLINSPVNHWCEFEFISKTVKNPNIHIKGNYSYYSAYWDQGFERCVVRYLHDKPATPEKPIDQLYIGNFVCFGAECVIMMGGNQLHRTDWISAFPFDTRSFVPAGDTVIGDGCWIGSRAMIMQGVHWVKALWWQPVLSSPKMYRLMQSLVVFLPKLLNIVFRRKI